MWHDFILQIRGELINKNEDERMLLNGECIMYYIQVCVVIQSHLWYSHC